MFVLNFNLAFFCFLLLWFDVTFIFKDFGHFFSKDWYLYFLNFLSSIYFVHFFFCFLCLSVEDFPGGFHSLSCGFSQLLHFNDLLRKYLGVSCFNSQLCSVIFIFVWLFTSPHCGHCSLSCSFFKSFFFLPRETLFVFKHRFLHWTCLIIRVLLTRENREWWG